ncbi:MAG: haloacid dehalogenase [Clostridiales bacterium GWE2_32_10]|nr:MAG: haloacid dehalogenase [Clostridiales bacterium GWE2_32_10]HBY19601.1 HAD-IB family hydrolase [Clostridiales bacterium]
MSNVGAFFDIDGTLYRENLQTELFKKLIRCGIINHSEWYSSLEEYYTKWDNRLGEYEDYLKHMSEIYCKSIKGLSLNVLRFIAKQVIEEKGGRVYTYTKNQILWHKKQSHKIITISGSPIELVEQISKKYEFDIYRGTVYTTEDENYTGELEPLWDTTHKQIALNEIVETYKLDLGKCYAYGDTNGDLSMFTKVGHPTCINPTKELLNNIKSNPDLKQKMNIIIERKDVIYKINLDSIDFI